MLLDISRIWRVKGNNEERTGRDMYADVCGMRSGSWSWSLASMQRMLIWV